MKNVCKYIVVLMLVMMHVCAFASAIPLIKLPADWKKDGFVIHLNDELQHPDLSWPVTLLRYQLDFGNNAPVNGQFTVVDGNTGKPVPFQLSGTTLYLLSDLPSGAKRSFRLLAARPQALSFANKVNIETAKDHVLLTNGLVKLVIPAATGKVKAPVLQYGTAANWLGEGELPGIFSQATMQVQQLEAGPLQAAYKISYQFTTNKNYTVVIRLSAAMEFAELQEAMTGFAAKDSLWWRIRWNGLHPGIRYTATRPGIAATTGSDFYTRYTREPMDGYTGTALSDKHPYQLNDQQNNAQGRLPFRLAVYDNWMSWWRLPTAAFWSEEANATSIGLFIKEAEQWNDEQYPLWGSKEALSIYYHWQNNLLDYRFPLVPGTRSTALAAYAHEKDIGLMNATQKPFAYIDYLRRYYGWIPLDKTKDWILNYEGSDGAYPKYFKAEQAGNKLGLGWLEQNLKNMVASVANGTERNGGPAPVGLRVVYESIVPSFDINRNAMSAAQYKKLRAWFLFMSYVCMDESLMPVRTMLSGHPNFLMDVKVVPGLSAFLFPGHPQSSELAAHLEKAIQLNYQFHIRPAVAPWQTQAGRWTENLATYTWAALRPTLRTIYLMQHYFDGQNRILQPGVADLGGWLLNTLTPPMDLAGNRRTYPPQGAHAQDFADGPPDLLRMLAQQLVYYDPLLAEHILWATNDHDKPFEGKRESSAVWTNVLKGAWENNTGTMPSLRSSKYTGYGVVLRNQFAQKDEMQVLLQQIDEGPGYRWGRAGSGGNGVIYYYAGGKRYSFNGPEDVGDGPFGDVERCTNFGVKKAPGYRGIGDYRSIGRGDLTAPLYDFDFAQSARLLGGKDIRDTYRSRSVLQSGSDYIVVYDDVANDNTEGRLSWFVGREDAFPFIHQVKPGIIPVTANIEPSQSSYHKDAAVLPTKGRYYDGKGDFLTVVTHRDALKVSRTAYGCEVLFPNGDADHVFCAGSAIQYRDSNMIFYGRSGIVKQAADKNVYAALFEGREIAAGGLRIVFATDNSAGISFEAMAEGGYTGKYKSAVAQDLRFHVKKTNKSFIFYIDGVAVSPQMTTDGAMIIRMPPGEHRWQFSAHGVVPGQPAITGTVNTSGGGRVHWTKVAGAATYQLQVSHDGGANWQTAVDDSKDTTAALTQLANGVKVHLRVTAKGAGGWSEPSAVYPLYVTDEAPHCPEGLTAIVREKNIDITWGELLGAGTYMLYRRIKQAGDSSWRLISSGPRRWFNDIKPQGQVIYEYAVTAVNGNGESTRSVIRSTDPGSFINWYPAVRPGFRRDTEDHENGFPEFNPFIEDKRPVLQYPVR